MKHYLSIALAIACIALVVSLIATKRSDKAQHETDAGTITDYSNRLDSAQLDAATYHGTVLLLSNRLGECQSASLAFSNQLTEAESALSSGRLRQAWFHPRRAWHFALLEHFQNEVAQASSPASCGGVSPPSPEWHRDGALTRSRNELRYVKNGNALIYPDLDWWKNHAPATRLRQGL